MKKAEKEGWEQSKENRVKRIKARKKKAEKEELKKKKRKENRALRSRIKKKHKNKRAEKEGREQRKEILTKDFFFFSFPLDSLPRGIRDPGVNKSTGAGQVTPTAEI